jgi:membrane-associated phospholipid phosphatase
LAAHRRRTVDQPLDGRPSRGQLPAQLLVPVRAHHDLDADKLVGFGSNNVGPVTADAFGAFPSLHIAWATWVVAVTFTLVRNPLLARVWIVYPFITLTAIVATGNHFVLDAVAGAILSFVALRLARHRWDRSAYALNADTDAALSADSADPQGSPA